MHYVVQENIFREEHYNLLFESLDRMKLDYSVIRLYPFANKIVDIKDIDPTNNYNVDDLPEFVPPTKNVFVFGAVNLARISKDRDWSPASLMNDNHDYTVYSKYYKDNLLNYDSEIVTVGTDFKWKANEIKFIRPTKDSKSFNGNTFNEKEWKESIEHNLHNYRSHAFNEETLIQVSSVKHIQKEIRFWVVDGKVVTGSQYRLKHIYKLDDQVEPEAIEFAQRMVDIYQLADAFVVDVCLTENGWKIVECGCINCAGFYRSDIQKMLNAVDLKFNKDHESN
jgi:hypothetical protein